MLKHLLKNLELSAATEYIDVPKNQNAIDLLYLICASDNLTVEQKKIIADAIIGIEFL